jgi:aspartate carbamoyltransferase catalytic subunit
VTEKWNSLDPNSSDVVGAGLDQDIDRAGISEEKIPSQRFKRISATEEQRRLQQRVAEERLVERWGMHHGAGPLHHRCVAAEVIGVSVRREHRHDLASKLLANDLQCLFGARVIEPGIDQHDLAGVVGKDSNVDATRNDPGAIVKRYQDSQSCSLDAGRGSVTGGHYTGPLGGNSVNRQSVTAVRHVVEVGQFDRPGIERLFAAADRMRDLPRQSTPFAGFTLATIFYEPSTRTRLSFETAMHKLGGNVISTENAREFSSAIKGETVEDTIRIVGGYADAIVIRHYEQGSAHRAAGVATVPVLNAGDGPGEHPSQALLDLYTIGHELGRIDGLRVALVGDLRYGRTARSLARLFRLTTGTELIFVSPPAVPMGEDVRAELDDSGIPYRDEPDLGAVLADVDVVYQTRVQKERFTTPEEYQSAHGQYGIDADAMRRLNPAAILLHPLPRVDEIATEVDSDPRAAYFRQAHNGVFIRMALLEHVLANSSPG